MSARLLVALLRDPAGAHALGAEQWNDVVSAARAERLIGTLAVRLANEVETLPPAVAAIMADARFDAAREARQALWEADRAALALAPLGLPALLLKGTAYAAAGLKAGEGRFIGDLDILVPRERLAEAEAALLAAGWEWVKDDPYDDAYYRRWMHELPPLIHRERDRMIDVHHTILPLTAARRSDAAAMIASAVPLGGGLAVLCPEDMICHAAAHMLADGDLAGGLRNLWDIHCLLSEFGAREGFWPALHARAVQHQLGQIVTGAARLAHDLYGTRIPQGWIIRGHADFLFKARLLARDGLGRETRKLLVLGFTIRSHLLRMPPLMLARHLWTKWRKGHRPV